MIFKIKRLRIIIYILIISSIILKICLEFNHSRFIDKTKGMAKDIEKKIKIDCFVENKKLDAKDYDIHYTLSGHEKDDLVLFLHPAFSDHRVFNQQIDFFAKKYKVICMDLIGHGLSERNKSTDKIDVSINHIEKILEKEGSKKVHLVGVSLGSLVAQYFALHHPEKVKSLTSLGGYNINRKNKEIAKAQRFVNLNLVFTALFSIKSFRQKAAKITCHSELGQAIFFHSTSYFTRRSFGVMQGLNSIIKERSHNQANYPSLILTGENDLEISRRIAKEWHNQIENSKFQIIKDAGHCAHIDQPIIFNNIVDEFISEFN